MVSYRWGAMPATGWHWQGLAPVGSVCGDFRNLNSICFLSLLWYNISGKSPASLCPPPLLSQSRANTLEDRNNHSNGVWGKWYSNDQTWKWNVIKITLPHALLIPFVHHTVIYWDTDFNTLHWRQDKNDRVECGFMKYAGTLLWCRLWRTGLTPSLRAQWEEWCFYCV